MRIAPSSAHPILWMVAAMAIVVLAAPRVAKGDGEAGTEPSSYVMLFFDTPTVEGALSPGHVLLALSDGDAALRACLNRSSTGTGDIELSAVMVLEADGLVSKATVAARGARDAPVEQCVAESLKRLRFPDTQGRKSTARVTLRLVAMEEPPPRDAAVLVASAGGGVAVGAQAPPLGIEELRNAPEGASATWDHLHGKVVVLEFWATWCGPCVAEIPHLNALVAEFAGKDVVFLSITDEEPAIVERFVKHKPMMGWQGFDRDGSAFEAYQIHGIPVTVVVARDGKVAHVTHPGDLTAATIRALLDGTK